MDQAGKWAAGIHYGPVLSRTDLYLLNASSNVELQLHPILAGSHKDFHLVFDLLDGRSGGYNPSNPDQDLPFSDKDQPATLPRVAELYIITELSPWCTIVKNETGVTMSNICTQIWKEYSENFVTDAELASIPTRMQEHVRRSAAHNSTTGWSMYYSPAPASGRIRRVDWLRERTHFDGLVRKDTYAESRLGFKAPNIFVMNLTS